MIRTGFAKLGVIFNLSLIGRIENLAWGPHAHDKVVGVGLRYWDMFYAAITDCSRVRT